MARTTNVIPVERQVDAEKAMCLVRDIVSRHGYTEKLVKEEQCWSRGDGVLEPIQCFALIFGEKKLILQGWMDQALLGESDLEGVWGFIPKRKMKQILGEIETGLKRLASEPY